MFIKLKILDENESEFFFASLKQYYSDKMELEKFVYLIEVEVEYQRLFGDNLEDEENDEDFSKNVGKYKKEGMKEIEIEFQQKEVDEDYYRVMILAKRDIKAIETMQIQKSTIKIQALYRRFLGRKLYFVMKVRQLVLIHRLQVKLKIKKRIK